MPAEIRSQVQVNVKETTQLIKELTIGPFPDKARETLVGAVNGKVAWLGSNLAHGVPCDKQRAPMQKHMYVQHYLTAADWDDLQNPRTDFNIKARRIVARLAAVGVKNPSEGTMVLATALLYFASSSDPK